MHQLGRRLAKLERVAGPQGVRGRADVLRLAGDELAAMAQSGDHRAGELAQAGVEPGEEALLYWLAHRTRPIPLAWLDWLVEGELD